MRLSQAYLKSILHYDPDSGVFTRAIKIGKHKAGDRAGWINTEGYVAICVNGVSFYAHRLAYLYMTGAFPKEQTDHINGIRHDNAWGNLRQVSHKQNGRNQKRSSVNTSGITGVYWSKQKNKWHARLCCRDKVIHIGFYECLEEASAARKAAEAEHGFHVNHGRKQIKLMEAGNHKLVSFQ